MHIIKFTAKLFLLIQLMLSPMILAKSHKLTELYEDENKLLVQFERIQAANVSSNYLYEYLENKQIITQNLDQWILLQRDFQEDLDSFIVKQQKFFLDSSYKNIHLLEHEIEKLHTLKSYHKKVIKLIKNITDARILFYDNLSEYGQNKDYRRINAYKKYFFQYAALMKKLGFERNTSSKWNKKLKKLIIREGFAHSGLVKELFFPKQRAHSAHPSTHLTFKLSSLIRNAFYKLGVEVQVEGVEHIPQASNLYLENTTELNIFAFQHGHGIMDELVKAHIPLNHYMIMWAVKIAPLPGFVLNRLETSHSIIPVGSSKKDSIEMTLDRIQKKSSNNIAIHPQGTLNVFNEILPVRKNFSYKLVKSLLAEGVKVNIIPVSSNYAPNFLSGNIDDMMNYEGGKTIRVVIHPVITNDMLLQLFEHESGFDALLLFLRTIWLEEAVQNKTQIFGQLKTKAIQERMEGLIGPMALPWRESNKQFLQ